MPRALSRLELLRRGGTTLTVLGLARMRGCTSYYVTHFRACRRVWARPQDPSLTAHSLPRMISGEDGITNGTSMPSSVGCRCMICFIFFVTKRQNNIIQSGALCISDSQFCAFGLFSPTGTYPPETNTRQGVGLHILFTVRME